MRTETGDAAAPIAETTASENEKYNSARALYQKTTSLSSTELLGENLAEQAWNYCPSKPKGAIPQLKTKN
jgi:hypothetical protein